MVRKTYDTWVAKISLNKIILCLFGTLVSMSNLPYGIAIFGYIYIYALLENKYPYYYALFPIAGYFLKGDLKTAVFYLLASTVLCGFHYFGNNIKKRNLRKTVCSLILLFSELLKCLFGGFLSYYVFVIILEAIVTYFLIDNFVVFVSYFSSNKLRKTISKSELISVMSVFFVSLSSLSNAELFYGIKPIAVISVYLILCMASAFDVSVCATAGSLLGILVGLSNFNMMYVIGTYSLSALFSSLCKNYKKIGIVSAFIITNAVVTFCVNESNDVLINIYEIFIASVFFTSTPVKKIEELKSRIRLLNPEKSREELKRVEFMRETAFKNLKLISGAVSSLSKALSEKPEKDVITNEELVTEITKRVCTECNNYSSCFKQREDFVKQTVNKTVDTIKKRGFSAEYDLPYSFKNSCIDYQKLILEANKVYEIYRINKVWESKISESRDAIKSQLFDVSESLSDFADDFTKNYKFEVDMEKQLITLLDKVGVSVISATVSRNLTSKIVAKVGIRHLGKRKTGELLLLTAASKIFDKKMKVSDSSLKDDGCFYTLEEDEIYKITTAVSRIRAEGNEKCGDNYAVIKPENGKSIIALSDGMGVGEKAEKNSLEAVNLLDVFVKSGIRKENAVKLINSVLILKSFDDSFATLDILVTDLYTGESEFIKTGGVSSYIIKENKIETVEGFSLPSGILPDVKSDTRKIKLCNTDVVVLMSDGVSDCFKDEDDVKYALKKSVRKNLKEFADSIMKEAYDKKGNKNDDMTVIIAKFTEK